MIKKTIIAVAVAGFSLCIQAQNRPSVARTINMNEVIALAQENSISSMTNRNIFAAAYWNWRSYRAERLPSLNLSTGIMNFNRSIVSLQDAASGSIYYRENYNLTNDATLSIRQNITATGGTLSIYTALTRLDQFSPLRTTSYYSQPISMSYLQPLWNFNSYKWNKKIEPHNYEVAKREYLENMEQVTINAVNYFWNYAVEKLNYDIALQNFENSKSLYNMSVERFKLGTTSRDNMRQLELKMLNDSLNINTCTMNLRSARNRLCSYIGYQDDTEIELLLDYDLPELTLDYNNVLETAMRNSSFEISQLVTSLEAERSVAQAKGNRGITASVNARFGLSNNADELSAVYRMLQDQEVVGVSLSVPILDWGMGKGKVKMAESQAQTTQNRLEQAMIDYKQELFVKVMQFNNQRRQCEISKRSSDIASENYQSMLKSFMSGSISVTELNNLQSDKDNAMKSYMSNISSFWNYYFTIRRTTLFDYISDTDINAEFDKLVE